MINLSIYSVSLDNAKYLEKINRSGAMIMSWHKDAAYDLYKWTALKMSEISISQR